MHIYAALRAMPTSGCQRYGGVTPSALLLRVPVDRLGQQLRFRHERFLHAAVAAAIMLLRASCYALSARRWRHASQAYALLIFDAATHER